MADFVFRRTELKYRLSLAQYEAVKKEIAKRLSPDAYGETTIQSLYFDTEDDRLARASIEKPIFKEKLRLRCYGRNENDRDVYLEMKRKYDGIVYKRRIPLKESEAPAYLAGRLPDTQIGREIAYFLSYYGKTVPKILILYDREAFAEENDGLRVTFDKNVRYRTKNFAFSLPTEGEPLLLPDTVLMELKIRDAMPLWLSALLVREGLYKDSFSKYGAAYLNEYKKQRENRSESLCLPLFLTETSVPSLSLPH